jgi:O6-methylguanine-DNA--protein-cysteine methyltransferase
LKSKEELRKELHQLTDSIEDEETLNLLHRDVVPYMAGTSTVKDELSTEQQMKLNEAIRQVDAGQVVLWDEYMEATKR